MSEIIMDSKNNECALHIASVIINICIENKISLNTSKLMKLLYIMQIEHFIKYKNLMFSDEITWGEYGPIIPNIDNYYIRGKLGFDKKVEQDIVLIDSHRDIAKNVLEKYGKYNPIDLTNLIVESTFYKEFKNNNYTNITSYLEMHLSIYDIYKDKKRLIKNKNN